MATDPKIYNILLLGETGVGKSTYLNTLLNYFTYEKLVDVTELKYFIGTRFILMNEDFIEKTITLGTDDNELHIPGKSATQSPKMHQINLPEGITLNLIDTPGIGDTEGLQNDYRNVERVLEYISELEYLNAICIVLKPNNTRMSIVFDYCIKTVLGQLDRNMRNNVLFVFTNGRSSFYTPGDTHGSLQKILDAMDPDKISPIPFNQYNTFCVENDWFRYIAAKEQGVSFTPKEIESYKESWDKSSATSKRMIDYIKSLPPRRLRGMLTINESKRLIRKLLTPINTLMESHRKDRRELKMKRDHLQNLLSNNNLLEENLITDVTTTGQKVSHIHVQEKTSKMRIGHDVSFIPPFYSVEIGPSNQTDVYEKKTEETVLLNQKVEDPYVKSQIANNSQQMKRIEDERKEIEDRINEYQSEMQLLLTAAAQFHVFLKENVPFYELDQTEAYLQRMIKETENIDAKDCKMYKDILKKYKVKKSSTYSVSIQDVQDIVQLLLNSKRTGVELKRQLGIDGQAAAIE